MTVTGPSCAPPSGSLTALRLGPVALGMTRDQAQTALPAYHVTDNGFDRSCSADGQNRIRVGYPSSRLLATLTAPQRTRLRGRVVLALTANSHYALDTIRPGTPVAALRRQLAGMQRFPIGRNTWYVISGAHATGVLKVQRATVQEIGIADRALTTTSPLQQTLLRSFS